MLGYVYQEQASSYLGFKQSISAGLGLSSLSSSAHIFATKYKVLQSGIKTLNVAKKGQKALKIAKQTNDLKAAKETHEGEYVHVDHAEEAAPESEEEVLKRVLDGEGLGSIVEMMWSITVVDVEATLRTICFKVLKDSSVSSKDRVKRAEGLMIIGEIFQSHAKESTAGLNEFMERMVPSPMK